MADTAGLAEARRGAEVLAERLPPLLVAAERVAATVAQGVHGRRRVGIGETFWQFRSYQPGDSLDMVDWRQSARSDHVFVRELEWEAAESVWFWIDRSAQMTYGSRRGEPPKLERAMVLGLALAALLVRAGERVALLGSRATGGRIALERMMQGLAEPGHDDGLPPAEPLPRYCRLVLIGDFIRPLPEIEARVRGFVAGSVRGHLLQVLDPAEETLPFAGRVLFEGMDGGARSLISRVEGVRGEYLDRLEAHRLALSDAARKAGWSFGTHRTDHPPETALLALYNALALKESG